MGLTASPDETVEDMLGAREPGSVFVAVVVADAWQRCGIGSRLVDAVLDEAEVLRVTRLGLSVPAGSLTHQIARSAA